MHYCVVFITPFTNSFLHWYFIWHHIVIRNLTEMLSFSLKVTNVELYYSLRFDAYGCIYLLHIVVWVILCTWSSIVSIFVQTVKIVDICYQSIQYFNIYQMCFCVCVLLRYICDTRWTVCKYPSGPVRLCEPHMHQWTELTLFHAITWGLIRPDSAPESMLRNSSCTTRNKSHWNLHQNILTFENVSCRMFYLVSTFFFTLLQVSQVSCGRNHTVVLLESGQVFAFGDNKKGQLALTTKTKIDTPQVVQQLLDKR